MNKALGNYYHKSRGLLYSYLSCLPVLVLYEILIRITQPGNEYMVRISVDIWFRQLLSFTGLHGLSATFLAAAIIGAAILYKKRAELPSLKKATFFWMITESAFYAFLLGIIISLFLSQLLAMNFTDGLDSLNKLQLFALSLGAGLYEELFFRVILVSFLLWVFRFFIKKSFWVHSLSVLTAALLFSGVHYVGMYGDNFELYSFLFRFLFGLALNLIYVKRGFGIAVWTHALYDVMVVASM